MGYYSTPTYICLGGSSNEYDWRAWTIGTAEAINETMSSPTGSDEMTLDQASADATSKIRRRRSESSPSQPEVLRVGKSPSSIDPSSTGDRSGAGVTASERKHTAEPITGVKTVRETARTRRQHPETVVARNLFGGSDGNEGDGGYGYPSATVPNGEEYARFDSSGNIGQ